MDNNNNNNIYFLVDRMFYLFIKFVYKSSTMKGDGGSENTNMNICFEFIYRLKYNMFLRREGNSFQILGTLSFICFNP